MIGLRPLSQGTTGSMPTHAFDLLVLALESFIQIWQMNQDVPEVRQVTWTMHSNLVMWFMGFWHFWLKYGFLAESKEGNSLVFGKAML